MRNINNISPLYMVLGLFAIYLILKWTCRLLFGVLDYVVIMAVIGYVRLPEYKKYNLHEHAKSSIKYVCQKLGID